MANGDNPVYVADPVTGALTPEVDPTAPVIDVVLGPVPADPAEPAVPAESAVPEGYTVLPDPGWPSAKRAQVPLYKPPGADPKNIATGGQPVQAGMMRPVGDPLGLGPEIGYLQKIRKNVADADVGPSTQKVLESQKKLGEAELEFAKNQLENNQKIASLRRVQARRTGQMRQQLMDTINTAQDAVNVKRDEYSKALQEYKNMPAEDPEGFWKDSEGKTSWGKVAVGAVAMALGALTSNKTGGQNQAMKVMNNLVNRNIQQQRRARAEKKEAIGQAYNSWQIAGKMFDDEYRRNLMAHNLELERVNNLVNVKMEEARTPQQAQQLQLIKAQNEAKQAKNANDIFVRTSQHELKQAQMGAGLTGQIMQGKRAAAQARAAMQPKRLPKFAPGYAVTDPETYANVSNQERAKLRESVGKFRQARLALKELVDWRDKEGFKLFPTSWSEAGAEGKEKALNAIRKLKDFYNMGAAFTESEEQLLNIPKDPGKWGYLLPGLEKQLEYMDRSQQALEQMYGITESQALMKQRGARQPMGN